MPENRQQERLLPGPHPAPLLGREEKRVVGVEKAVDQEGIWGLLRFYFGSLRACDASSFWSRQLVPFFSESWD